MRNHGIGSWMARRARMAPGRTAVVHGQTAYSYAQAHERTLRLAHALRELGIRHGDRVAYMGPNHPAFLETLFATCNLGAIFVPLSARLAGPELAFGLSDSGSSVLVYGAECSQLVGSVRRELAVRH